MNTLTVDVTYTESYWGTKFLIIPWRKRRQVTRKVRGHGGFWRTVNADGSLGELVMLDHILADALWDLSLTDFDDLMPGHVVSPEGYTVTVEDLSAPEEPSEELQRFGQMVNEIMHGDEEIDAAVEEAVNEALAELDIEYVGEESPYVGEDGVRGPDAEGPYTVFGVKGEKGPDDSALTKTEADVLVDDLLEETRRTPSYVEPTFSAPEPEPVRSAPSYSAPSYSAPEPEPTRSYPSYSSPSYESSSPSWSSSDSSSSSSSSSSSDSGSSFD